MNFYLARIMAIVLFSMATACSLNWQNVSQKDKHPESTTLPPLPSGQKRGEIQAYQGKKDVFPQTAFQSYPSPPFKEPIRLEDNKTEVKPQAKPMGERLDLPQEREIPVLKEEAFQSPLIPDLTSEKNNPQESEVPALKEEAFQSPFVTSLTSKENQPQEGEVTALQAGTFPSPSVPSLTSEKNQPPDPKSLLDEALEFFQGSQDFWEKGDLKNAIAALDQAYRLILQIHSDGHQDLEREKENIRFIICKRMLEIYASQRTSVNGPQKAIPLTMNPYVEREIKRFMGPEKFFFVEAYKRSGRYRPVIIEALEKAGFPKELSWLPLIESGFKVNAFSSARALGLWQFIPSTGYKFGLRRDRWLDERMDVQKSTRAAISYLQELHNIFGDWYTVLAAYNCGESRVLEVIRTQKINYLDNFWDLFQKLPQETARYVPRFMAALFIIDNPERFGFDLEEPYPPFPYEVVKISKQVFLKDVAKTLVVSPESIEILNPELRFKITPAGPYDLKVPIGKGNLLLAKLDEIPISKFRQQFYSWHRVQGGESLWQLASRYHTSTQAIAETNRIREKDFLRVGQKLKIPLGEKRVSKDTETEAEIITAENSELRRYRVKRGDSLWKIVQLHKTNIQEIMRLNNLKSILLQIGQELLIPQGK